MKLNWTHIYEGWSNHLFPPEEIKGLIQQTATERIEVCKDCHFNSRSAIEHCTICGCPLVALTKCLSCDCSDSPPRWRAVLTINQQEDINSGDEQT